MAEAPTVAHPAMEPAVTSFPARRRSRLALVSSTVAATIILHFTRFGYGFGSSDQDETVPLVLRVLDERLFMGDWFIQSQSAALGVRSVFVYLMAALSSIMPVWIAFAVVHFASIALVATAVYRLANRLTGSDIAAVTTVIAAMVLLPQWTLGGNDLTHSMLVPSTIAWGAGLWALTLHLDGRPVAAGLLLGISVAFQALVGLQLASVVAVHLAAEGVNGGWRTVSRRALRFALSFLLLAVPLVLPLALSQAATSDGSAYPSLFYVMAAFRNPHHYLPLSFPLSSYAKFSLLAVGGVWAYFTLRRRGELVGERFVVALAAYVAILLSLGFVFTELVPVLLVAKLQLFKTTVLAKVVMLTLLGGALVGRFSRTQTAEAWIRRRPGQTGAALLLASVLVFVGLAFRGGGLAARVSPVAHARSDLGEVERWARASTDIGATFVVPPSTSTFRTGARRSIVINYKAFPFEPPQVRTWFKMLTAIAPVDLPARAGPDMQQELDRAYASQSPERLAALAIEFGADFVLQHEPLPPSDAIVQVFASGSWRVYRPLRTFGARLASLPTSDAGRG